MRIAPTRNSIVHRTFDPSRLNAVANADGVREWLGGEGALDVAALIDNTANFALETTGGGFVLQQLEPGVYEVHSLFLPEHRANTVEAMSDGLVYMFTRTDCRRIVTMVPDNNKPASALAMRGGFRKLFHRPGPLGPATYMALDLDDWAMREEWLEDYGEWFHEKLEDAKREVGSALPVHDHDPAHERAVGCAVMMMLAGNAAKGIDFYNGWARFAGYATIGAFSFTPAVVDVVDAVVEIGNNDMRVLLCR